MTAPGAPAPAGNDKTTLFGVLGIILALPFCCWPVGLVFAFLSLNQAKRYGSQPTLAYVAFAIAAVSILLTILNFTFGWYSP
jgi:hypothetical protein